MTELYLGDIEEQMMPIRNLSRNPLQSCQITQNETEK